jgi:hypothetical protein
MKLLYVHSSSKLFSLNMAMKKCLKDNVFAFQADKQIKKVQKPKTVQDNTDKERCRTNSGKQGSLLWLLMFKSDILLSEGEGVLSFLFSSSVGTDEGLLMKVPTNTSSTVDDDGGGGDDDDDDDRVDVDGKGL